MNRIYERLRKRSYRQSVRLGGGWSGMWHNAYVSGVHDTLAEIDRDPYVKAQKRG